MTLNFPCFYCDLIFKSETKLNSHSLFTHFKLNPVCSNSKLISREIIESDLIRKEFQFLRKKINYYELHYDFSKYIYHSQYPKHFLFNDREYEYSIYVFGYANYQLFIKNKKGFQKYLNYKNSLSKLFIIAKIYGVLLGI